MARAFRTAGLGLAAALAAAAGPARAARHTASRPVPPRAAAKAAGPRLVSLQVLPREVSLNGPNSRQLLVVTGLYSDGTARDLSTRASYRTIRPGMASVSTAGLITPAADGEAGVRVSVGSITTQVPVRVAESQTATGVSFTRDVVPVLTRAGCNGLSCHGSPVG